ncbi:MAG: hypothetical protein MMC23_008287 [Stictis urceolatum]|nr:hypothetical protein [Stictis urceolata]
MVLQEAIHHTVVSASNLTESLSFYVDGIGLDIVRNTTFEGDLKTLFGSDSTALPGYYLGDNSSVHNGTAGILYLVQFADVQKHPKPHSKRPQTGLFLTSFWVGNKLNATLARLEALGLGGKPHIATFGTDPLATYATVRDPDGVRVLLVNRPFINSVGQQIS